MTGSGGKSPVLQRMREHCHYLEAVSAREAHSVERTQAPRSHVLQHAGGRRPLPVCFNGV
jgi:hypothetical protein